MKGWGVLQYTLQPDENEGVGNRFWSEDASFPVVGITHDLAVRRREPQRSTLGRGSLTCTAAEALLRQLRGLELGLPPNDRAFVTDLYERIRRYELPARPELPAVMDGPGVALEVLAGAPPMCAAWATIQPQLFQPSEADLRHGRGTALVALRLCRSTGIDPQDAFLAGLFHDIGRPYLRAVAVRADASRQPRPSTVSQVADGLHPPFGAVLLEAWGFPSQVQLAVEHHHQPTPAIPTAVRPLTHVVQASDLFSHLLLSREAPDDSGRLARELESILRQLELEPDLHMLEDLQSELDAWCGVDSPR